MTKHQEWDSSSSIHEMEFERKPLLDDISIVIPTLGQTDPGTMPILDPYGQHLARLLDRGGPGLEHRCSWLAGARAAYWNPGQTYSFDAARALGGN